LSWESLTKGVSGPLAALDSFNSAPKIQRRAASREELVRVLQAAPLDRQLLYETAFVSGLRRNELAQLTPAHVDLENEALRLDPNWTKNRKPGLQPVPRSLEKAQILTVVREQMAAA